MRPILVSLAILFSSQGFAVTAVQPGNYELMGLMKWAGKAWTFEINPGSAGSFKFTLKKDVYLLPASRTMTFHNKLAFVKLRVEKSCVQPCIASLTSKPLRLANPRELKKYPANLKPN